MSHFWSPKFQFDTSTLIREFLYQQLSEAGERVSGRHLTPTVNMYINNTPVEHFSPHISRNGLLSRLRVVVSLFIYFFISLKLREKYFPRILSSKVVKLFVIFFYISCQFLMETFAECAV